MRMSQYVSFAVRSLTVPAAKMTAQLGVQPDLERVRGEVRSQPRMVPAEHAWEICCADKSTTLDTQIDRVIERLLPLRDALSTLVRGDDQLHAELLLFRNFNDLKGESALSGGGAGSDMLAWLSGVHHLLGWRLRSEHLEFLASIPADIVAEENG